MFTSSSPRAPGARRTRPGAALVAFGVLLAGVGLAPEAPRAGAVPAAVVVDALDGVAPELGRLAVTSRDVSDAEAAVRTFREALANTAADQAAAERDLAVLAQDATSLAEHRAGLQRDLDAALARARDARAEAAGHAGRADGVRAVLEDLAAAAYMGLGTDLPPLAGEAVTDADRRASYGRNVFELKRAEWRLELEQRDAALARAAAADGDAADRSGSIAELDVARDTNRAQVAAADDRRRSALDHQADFTARLADAGAALARARRTAMVVGLDVPLVVLDALWKAAATENAERPTCRLSWSLLAGISKIESGNGRAGRAHVDAEGNVQPRIVGPPLDGAAFALVPDTDQGRYDGDTTYDRAVGPMQFIPSSWVLFGRDGNHDGVADPNNYYDAASGAAEHLCRGGADTSTDAGRRAAVLSYNHSEDYLRLVVGQAESYARFAIPG